MKDFYERYWQNKLPKDIMFYTNKPIWGDKELRQHKDWVDKWALKDSDMLDYGCGNGKFTDYIHATGVDISPTAIKKAKEDYPKTAFYLTEELKDKKFGSIFLFDVLEHIFDFDQIFQELNKHTGRGSRVLITTSEIGFFKMLLVGLFYLNIFFHPYSPHIRHFTRKTLSYLLELHGYKVIHYERISSYFGLISMGQLMVAERI